MSEFKADLAGAGDNIVVEGDLLGLLHAVRGAHVAHAARRHCSCDTADLAVAGVDLVELAVVGLYLILLTCCLRSVSSR